MNIKKVFFVSFIIGLCIPLFTSAQITITEIMYNPEGTDSKREWIEVFNAGNVDVDLAGYFLLENNVYHKLTATNGSVLQGGAYAIIADSATDIVGEYPAFSGLIFDSVFSLNNTGESLVIADSAKQEIDSFVYSSEMGANGDGHSLQINGTDMVTASPTFGEINKTESEVIEKESDEDTGSSSSSSNNSSHSEQAPVSSYTASADFKVDAGRKRLVSINTPIEFNGFISKSDVKVRYHWNFGDFNIDTGRSVDHIYRYPGTYQIVLQAKNKDYVGVARTEVVVVEPQIMIETSSSTLAFKNLDSKEVNIGGFRIVLNNKTVTVPEDTIIKSKGSIIFPKEIDQQMLAFEYPNKKVYRTFSQ